jgi:hypothetical protein
LPVETGAEQGAGGHGFATGRIGDAALCVGDDCAVLNHGGLEADLITVRDEFVEDRLHRMLETSVTSDKRHESIRSVPCRGDVTNHCSLL